MQQILDSGLSRVARRAVVPKGVLRDALLFGDKAEFAYACVIEGLGNVHIFLKLAYAAHERVYEVHLAEALKRESPADIGIVTHGASVAAVIFDDIGHEYRVAKAVRQAESAAYGVGEGVRYAQLSVGKRHARHALGDMHIAASGKVAVIAVLKIAEDDGYRVYGEGIREV